ncbi:MAG: hypothetical protein EXR69_02575 [Myxococcales bacterium]|nr:hypothetical protein [Myxococcales bacterium]
MTRVVTRVVALLGLLACHPESTLTGTARDELRLVGLAEVLVIPGSPSERCPPLHLLPDSSGAFSAKVCSAQTYTVSWAPGGAVAWRAETVTARGGDTVALSAWPAGNEPGVYILGETVTRLPPPVQLETSPVLPSKTSVRYPLEIPDHVPRVLPGQFLLLQGSEADDRLIRLGSSTGSLSFARDNPPTRMGPWSFEGVDIGKDGTVTPLPAVVVPPTHHIVQDVPLAYVYADAVPTGRYLVGKPDSARAWMVDFGAAP